MGFSPWSECVTIIARDLGINVTSNNLQHIIQNGGSHEEIMKNTINYIGLNYKNERKIKEYSKASISRICTIK